MSAPVFSQLPKPSGDRTGAIVWEMAAKALSRRSVWAALWRGGSYSLLISIVMAARPNSRNWRGTAGTLSPGEGAMSHTHRSARDSAKTISARVGSVTGSTVLSAGIAITIAPPYPRLAG